MSKKWTESQLEKIYIYHPELRLVPLMKIDDVVIEFLKIHEVEARPPKNTSRRDGAIAGAITGMAGADVGGDAFLIQGQNKQTQIQEWTQWKQWALDHKDFEGFKKNRIEENKIFNKTILEKINSDSLKEELEKIIKPNPIFDISDQFAYRVFLIGFLVIFGSMIFFLMESREKEEISTIKKSESLEIKMVNYK